MKLNKQKGNTYKWITHTWNPLCGKCPYECIYCYVDKMKKMNYILNKKYSGKPRIDKNHISIDLGENNNIFVCNMNDLFSNIIDNKIIKKILNKCKKFPKNTYLFQTKNPSKFLEFEEYEFPIKSILSTTIETNIMIDNISKAPIPVDRALDMINVRKKFKNLEIGIFIEPIIKFWEYGFPNILLNINPNFIFIGTDSKNKKLIEPTMKQLMNFISKINKSNIKIIINENTERLKKGYI